MVISLNKMKVTQIFIQTLIILVWFAHRSYSLHQPSVKIDLFHHAYCYVKIGAPSTTETLLVRPDVDHVYLSSSVAMAVNYHTSAEMYTDTQTNVSHGTDVFQFTALEPVKMEVMWFTHGMPSPDDGIPRISYDGVLGLGPKSPLWKYWSGYTMDAWSLTLHAHQTLLHNYTLASPFSVPVPYSLSVGLYCTKENKMKLGDNPTISIITEHPEHSNFTCEMKLNPGKAITVFPDKSRSDNKMQLYMGDEKVASVHEMVSVQDAFGQIKDMAMFKTNQTSVEMGFWGMRYFTIHVDMRNETWCIYPSYFYLVNSENDCWFSVISATVLGIILGVWVLGSLSFFVIENLNSILILLSIKILGLMWGFISIVFHLKCYNGDDIFEKFSGGYSGAEYYLIIVLTLFFMVIDLACAYVSILYFIAKDISCVSRPIIQCIITINKFIFECVILVIVWLCLIGDAQNSRLILRNLIVAVLILTLAIINFFITIVQKSPVILPSLIITILSIFFLVRYNVLVYEGSYNFKYDSVQEAIVAIFFITLCLFLSLYFFSGYHDYWIYNMITKVIKIEL